MSEYTDTLTSLARATGLHARTIKIYCKKRQLDFITDASGRYLLRTGQAEKVKSILAESRAKQAQSLQYANKHLTLDKPS